MSRPSDTRPGPPPPPPPGTVSYEENVAMFHAVERARIRAGAGPLRRLRCWWSGHDLDHRIHACRRCGRTCEELAEELEFRELMRELNDFDWPVA